MKKFLCFVLLLTFIFSALGGCYWMRDPYNWNEDDWKEIDLDDSNDNDEEDSYDDNWGDNDNENNDGGGDINDKEFSECDDEELLELGYSEEELYDMGGYAGYDIGKEDGFLGEEYYNGCDSNSYTYKNGYADGYEMGYFEGQGEFMEFVYSSDYSAYEIAYDTGAANAYNHAIRGQGYNDVFYNEMLNEDEEFVQGYQDGYASGYQQGMDEVDNNGGNSGGDSNNGWDDEGDNNNEDNGNGGSGMGIKYTDAFLDFRIYEGGYHTIRSEVESNEKSGLETVGYVLYFWGPMNDVEPEDLALYYEDTIDIREEELTNRGGLALWGDVHVYSTYFISPSGEPSLEEFREWRIYDEPGLELKYLNPNALARANFDMYRQFEKFFNVDVYPTVILLDMNYRTINRYESYAPIDQIINNVFDNYYS